ncbi:sensor histidine kinase [Chryseobacterium rhizosphaerae]|jgi:Signal transduction histidine kinase|uniref:histidine kinase n=1 Tax=Chryseobacterium rhizosphaerae TaxID=395937 RepID=A0ABX9IJJ5_9FLAO|nr:HAMP domain-containing sensor histidine kinase [Chryseobacterium rhizosphaerae]MDR6545920.1 signal transduction histidine kinase [Chryseobacterium rhizosphaerae]REC74288.1 sensor histidine kinase [Chryseobacterium rhizosphaerae]GEN68308.1 two-component sensor histidine kinase [Chryseobacterium rhizosphaerae]
MKVSLKYYTIKYLIMILLLIIAVWAGLFYAYILDEVHDNVDDGLRDRKIQIIKAVYLNPQLLKNNDFGFNEFKINPITAGEYKNKSRLYNKMYYMEYDDKDQPYRVLEADFIDQYKMNQRLVIRTSTVEEDELIYDLTTALIVLYIVLVISIVVVNGYLLNKAMRPFYLILDKLKKYQFGIPADQENKEYIIKEFEELNVEINEMIERNELVFYQQKQFIENASHELQTPLAIVINKIDLLIQNDDLDEKNLNFLTGVKNDLRRMVGLNKSLLMLSKIENSQFNKTAGVDFNALIGKLVQNYEDFIEFKKVDVNIIEKGSFEADFNRDLADILLSNLLKNAIKYNNEEGTLNIMIEDDRITFQNSGAAVGLDPSRIFDRFYKQSSDHTSTGLGLSIIKTIIKQYPGWDIVYKFEDKMHYFILEKNKI